MKPSRSAPRRLLRSLRAGGFELRPPLRFQILQRQFLVALDRDLADRPLRRFPQFGLLFVSQSEPGPTRILVDAREKASTDDPVLVVKQGIVAVIAQPRMSGVCEVRFRSKP